MLENRVLLSLNNLQDETLILQCSCRSNECETVVAGVEVFLLGGSPCNVHGLELVETSQDTSSSNTTEDIGPSALHQAHEALVLQDLHSAVDGTLVLDSTTGGHHHPPPDCINGVGHQASANSDSPSKEERGSDGGVLASDQHWLQGVPM